MTNFSEIDPYIPQQFAYAKSQGWIEAFAKSAEEYNWPPALVMAIASRETNMKNEIGDGGHGYSLMQIDIRSFPDWCASGAWRDGAGAIEKGVQVLESKRTQFGRGVGQGLVIGGQQFVGKAFGTGDELNRVAIAGYNAGLWAYYSFSNGQDPDRLTTGHDYSADVLYRAGLFAKLLGGV